jgi:hypothetical protein
MDLPKLGIRDTYLLKPKWLKRNIDKVHLKGECPRKDISRLDDQEGVRKNRKTPLTSTEVIEIELDINITIATLTL